MTEGAAVVGQEAPRVQTVYVRSLLWFRRGKRVRYRFGERMLPRRTLVRLKYLPAVIREAPSGSQRLDYPESCTDVEV